MDTYRKRKAIYAHADHELLKPPEHELLHSSPDNYVVTPHRKRRPGFHNSPAQNPPFTPTYLEDYANRERKGFLSPSASAPPTYITGISLFHIYLHYFIFGTNFSQKLNQN